MKDRQRLRVRRSTEHASQPVRASRALRAAADPLIALQRQLGNRQVSALMAGRGGAASAIHRKIATSSGQVAAVQSQGDKRKAMIGMGTLNRLIKALKDYERCEAPKEMGWYASVVAGLAEHWLEKNLDEPNNRRKALIEDVAAQAKAETGRLQAMDKYLKDMKNGQVGALSQLGKDNALPEAATLAAGKTGKGMLGAQVSALEMAQKYGLTEAEIAAVKIYTASDYLYINPATANSQGWMGAQEANIKTNQAQKAPTSKKELMEMGALHAGAMMQALSKFEPIVATTYRGSRESMASFKAKYQDTNVMKFSAFGSSASVLGPAENFANGKGENTPLPDQTVRVLCVVQVNNGRQLSGLSIYGAGENEVLLLPGSEFSISSIEQHAEGAEGRPPATAWYTVHMTQTK